MNLNSVFSVEVEVGCIYYCPQLLQYFYYYIKINVLQILKTVVRIHTNDIINPSVSLHQSLQVLSYIPFRAQA